jgi:hypothetical protein
MRELRRQCRLKRLKDYLGRLERWQTAHQLKQLVSQMMVAFGGADGFITEYFQLCQDAKRTRDGLRLRTRLMLSLTRLNEAADLLIQQAKAESPFDYWTNDEIEREHDRLSRWTTEFNADENSSNGT